MFRLYSILLFFLGVMISTVALAKDPNVGRLEKKPPPKLVEPPIAIHTFSNGLKLYFLENHELPLLEVSALIEAGSKLDPADQKGLAQLMMMGLMTGGSRHDSGDEIDNQLEQVASEITTETKIEYSTLKLKSLIQEADLSLKIFFDLLKEPQFEVSKLAIVKQQMLEVVQGRNEKPMEIANREFMQALYGPESIWSRLYSVKTLKNIERPDVIHFYQRYVAPNHMRLAVSGDIRFEELIQKIEGFISGWQAQEINYPPMEVVQKEEKASVYVIPKISNQSAIVIGHFGEKRFNPDKYALILANHILGGLTFGSKLGDRIRTSLGLAYSVSSHFGLETDYGAFRVMVGTKSESTSQVVNETQKIIRQMVDGVISRDELKAAKNTILNQLIFQYEDPFEIVEDRMKYDFYGYPPHYLSIVQRELKKVSLRKVKKVVKKYFFPDKLQVMIVGDPKEMGDLSGLGEVQVLTLDSE